MSPLLELVLDGLITTQKLDLEDFTRSLSLRNVQRKNERLVCQVW